MRKWERNWACNMMAVVPACNRYRIILWSSFPFFLTKRIPSLDIVFFLLPLGSMNCAHYPKSASTAFLRLLFYVSLLLLCFFTGLAPWLQVIDEGIEIGFPFHCVCVCKRIQTHARTLGSLLTQPFQQQRPSVEGQQSSCSQRFLFPLCFYYSFH